MGVNISTQRRKGRSSTTDGTDRTDRKAGDCYPCNPCHMWQKVFPAKSSLRLWAFASLRLNSWHGHGFDPELFQLSCDDFTKTRKRPKTYGRFLGTIFLREVESAEVTRHQQFARQKNSKKQKSACENVIFFRRKPRFSAKTPKKRPFFAVSTSF